MTTGASTLLILGAGAVVREYYLDALGRLGCLGRVHVADVSPEALADLARFEVAGVHVGGLEVLQALKGVENVVVALPNRLHAQACLAALRAGHRVLVEKPVALTAWDHESVVAESRQRTVPVYVGMSRRFTQAFQAMWRFVRDGGIGDLLAVDIEDGDEYAWTSDTGESFSPANGGVLADMGVHFLDYATLLGGRVQVDRYEDDWRGGVEANCELSGRTEAGFPVRMRLSRTRPLRNTIVVRGTRGATEIRKGEFASFVLRTPGLPADYRLAATGDGAAPYGVDFTAAFAEQFRLFLDAPPGGSTALGVTLPDAAALLDVTRTVEECHARREGARPVATRAGRPVALVTGASGFIGGRLVEALGERGNHDLILPVRRFRTCAGIARYRADMPRVDLRDGTAVAGLLRGVRLVIHLAYGRDGGPREQTATTVEATRNVVEGAILGGAEAVVVLSSIAVFGHPPDALVDESWPYRPSYGPYGRAKAQVERWCLRRSKTSGATRIVVLNPTCVFGPGGGTYTRTPLELARDGLYCWVDGGVGIANVVYVDDVVDAILRAAEVEDAHGQRFIVTDASLTWRSFLGPLLGDLAATVPSVDAATLRARRHRPLRPAVAEALGHILSDEAVRRALGDTWPYGMARTVMSWMPGRRAGPRPPGRVLAGEPGSPRRPPGWLAEVFGPTTTRFSAARARSVLGWSPRVSVEEGTRRSLEWLAGLGLR